MAKGKSARAEGARESASAPRFEAELRRGVLQLVALHLLDRPRYGYDLVRELADRGFQVEEGTLYPILRRFEKQGALSSRWDTEGARPRKYYTLSEAGREVLAQMRAAWQEVQVATEGALGAAAEPPPNDEPNDDLGDEQEDDA